MSQGSSLGPKGYSNSAVTPDFAVYPVHWQMTTGTEVGKNCIIDFFKRAISESTWNFYFVSEQHIILASATRTTREMTTWFCYTKNIIYVGIYSFILLATQPTKYHFHWACSVKTTFLKKLKKMNLWKSKEIRTSSTGNKEVGIDYGITRKREVQWKKNG